MNQLTIDFERPMETARAGRNEGMRRAADHAEAEDPGWKGRADALLSRYVETIGRSFTSFEFRQWADGKIDPPPTPKAWGPVFYRAATRGVIHKAGYQPHPERHASPTAVWSAT